MPIEVAVQGAYSKGGIPLNVHGIANVKIAGEQPVLDNAIERFLGVDRARIMSIAKDTLEGNLRGVLATLTPEELNQDKIKFAQSLLSEAEDDLRRLGLELDTLKIQDVSDDVELPGQHRAQAVGRGAEERAHRRGPRQGGVAPCSRRATGARPRCRRSRRRSRHRARRQRAPAGRRADPRRARWSRRRRGRSPSQLARAEGELEVQKARIEQVKRQLAADVLEPARASKAAAEASAKGAAAQIVEQGRATAAAMGEIAATWRQVGPSARSVFLMQKVADLMRIVMSTVGPLKVDRLTVLGGIGGGANGAGGDGAGGGLPDLTGRLIAASEQIKAATGIDIAAALRARTPPSSTPR